MGKKPNTKKSSACSGRWCENHAFEIRPRYVLQPHPKEVNLRLCPTFNRERKEFESVLPLLNYDRKFYTPLFILEEDRKLYADHDEANMRSFEHSRLFEERSISDIMVPKVGSSNPYCKVCKEDYKDYLEHIASVAHCSNLRTHPYCAFIAEIVDNFKSTCNKQKDPEENINHIHCQRHPSFMDQECQLIQRQTALRSKEINVDRGETPFRPS